MQVGENCAILERMIVSNIIIVVGSSKTHKIDVIRHRARYARIGFYEISPKVFEWKSIAKCLVEDVGVRDFKELFYLNYIDCWEPWWPRIYKKSSI